MVFKNIKSIMRKNVTFLSFILLMALVISSGCTDYHSKEEMNKERIIINEIAPLVSKCHEYDSQNIAIYGDILGADLTDNNTRGYVYPENLRDRWGMVTDTPNGPFTIFITNNTWKKYAGDYSIKGSKFAVPVYTQSSDICVITWPEKKILGYKVVDGHVGENFTISGSTYPIVLSNGKEIEMWVASLPLT